MTKHRQPQGKPTDRSEYQRGPAMESIWLLRWARMGQACEILVSSAMFEDERGRTYGTSC